MEVKIKVDGEEKEENLLFTNDELDNFNFISLITPDSKEYILSVNDLQAISKIARFYQKRYENI